MTIEPVNDIDKTNKSIDEFAKATCLLLIQHYRNIIKLRESTNESIGYHSRLLERMLHPEERLILKGFSKRAKEENRIYKEHIVPLGYLANEIWKVLEENKLSDQECADLLYKHLGIAIITPDEARLVDVENGLKVCMPERWVFGKDDPLDRFKHCGIELEGVDS